MNAEEIIQAIKTKANLPSDGGLLYGNNEELLSFVNQTLREDIFSLYRDLDDTRYLVCEDYKVDELKKSNIGKGIELTIPADAHQRSLHELLLLSASDVEINIPVVQPGVSISGVFAIIMDNTIFLKNVPVGYFKIRLYYHRRLHQLVFKNKQVEVSSVYKLNERKKMYADALLFSGNNFFVVYLKEWEERVLLGKEIIAGVHPQMPKLNVQGKDPMNIMHLKNYQFSKYYDNGRDDEWRLDIVDDPLPIEVGATITRYEEVASPQLPEEGVYLLILKTVLNLTVPNEVKEKVSAEYADAVVRLGRESRRRVSMETKVIRSFGTLWET